VFPNFSRLSKIPFPLFPAGISLSLHRSCLFHSVAGVMRARSGLGHPLFARGPAIRPAVASPSFAFRTRLAHANLADVKLFSALLIMARRLR
jgi:hypothetical protein